MNSVLRVTVLAAGWDSQVARKIAKVPFREWQV
jgi:hypothetical protein